MTEAGQQDECIAGQHFKGNVAGQCSMRDCSRVVYGNGSKARTSFQSDILSQWNGIVYSSDYLKPCHPCKLAIQLHVVCVRDLRPCSWRYPWKIAHIWNIHVSIHLSVFRSVCVKNHSYEYCRSSSICPLPWHGHDNGQMASICLCLCPCLRKIAIWLTQVLIPLSVSMSQTWITCKWMTSFRIPEKIRNMEYVLRHASLYM